MKDIPIVFVWDGEGRTWRHSLLQEKPVRNLRAGETKKPSWFDGQVSRSVSYVQPVRPEPPKKEGKIWGYKANRLLKGQAVLSRREILEQVPCLLEALDLLGIRSFKVSNLEGDDLIGILMRKIKRGGLFEEVIIHSTDKDFYQFLPIKDVRILKGVNNGALSFVRPEEVVLEYGINASDWVKYRTIVGDKSDNIPSLIPGVGPVKAVKLLKAGLDASVKSPDEIPESAKVLVGDFLKGPVDWKEFWKKVRNNYLASHIVRDPDFELFSSRVKDDLKVLLGDLSRDSFLRDGKWRSTESYNALSALFAEKGLITIKARREEFFELV